jgi:hypothetical protein
MRRKRNTERHPWSSVVIRDIVESATGHGEVLRAMKKDPAVAKLRADETSARPEREKNSLGRFRIVGG